MTLNSSHALNFNKELHVTHFKLQIRNNLVKTVPASLNYKFSADVFCTKTMPVGEGFNIFHVTAGGNIGSPGDRQFALLRNWNSQKLALNINYPKVGVYPVKVSHLDCEDGSWNTYSVEVRQVEGSPETLKYVVSIDGNIIEEGTYDQSAAVSSGDLKVFVADDWFNAATDFHVKNFFYQFW